MKMLESALAKGLQLAREDAEPWLLELLEGHRDVAGKVTVPGLDMESPDFSAKELKRFVAAQIVKQGRRNGNLEATTSGTLGQLLRVDVQNRANAWYKENQAELSINSIPSQGTSNKAGEFYAPLMSALVQTEVDQDEPFQQSGQKGVDVMIPNKKFMGGESFSRELWDDDKTGQISGRSQSLAEAAVRTQEIILALRFPGAGGSFGPLIVGADPWNTYPTSLNDFDNTLSGLFTVRAGATGLGNRLTAFLQLGTSGLKEAAWLCRQTRDRQGTRFAQRPDTLFISPTDEVAANVLMGSQYWPMVQGTSATSFLTAPSSVNPGAGAMNPWRGAYKVVMNNYLADWSWYLGQAGKGYVYQIRDALEITQEAPNSGDNFNRDVTRLRTRVRSAQAWLEPRLWIQGNDGTTTGVF